MRYFIISMLACFCAGAAQAQEAQQKKPVRVETEREHHGASHQHTRANPAAVEHHSTASWHYHRGQKRPQVAVDGAAIKDSVKH